VSDEQIGAAIRRAAETVSAPPALRARIEAGAVGAPPRRRWFAVPRLAFGGALAAVAAAVVLLLVGGAPTVTQVASASLRAPTGAASEAPYRGGWEPVGARMDSVGGREAKTVVYRKDGTGVHYTVLSGKPIDRPAGRTVTVDGRTYRILRDGPTAIATWEWKHHTCVLASRQTDWHGLVAFLRVYGELWSDR
jgi:hypothetical protein